ncbi:kinesin-like protein KIN-12E isoform X2 [Phoenix dactylifera]|uniref:Kinesin-like protein KIN-12E isoform X2 n=1 Tax=Phoenix dactylifera TaxID=42345 RepID=A0A8B7MT37_PHODC|nr:kinesin-like protein KIN-12E isoform X2 [Phoenix dactylifera]
MSFSSRRSGSRTRPVEGNENEQGNPADAVPVPLPRSPLISIQDRSQNPREGPSSELRLADFPIKGSSATTRSAPSTPARGLSRVCSGIGSWGANNAGHQLAGRERGCSSRVSTGIPDVKSLVPVDVPHFEFNEDPSFWKDHNVQVLIRIRPISGAESALQGYKRCLVQESSQTLVWTGHPETRFTFDHVACETTSQVKLFKVVGLPMVENCMSGYNSCMFAYGQTGSGKTHTMMGEIREMDKILCEDRGMTPRIFEYLFSRIREEETSRSGEQLKYSCKCSFLEIYNEQITDLLEPSSTNLQLREDLKKGVYVENLKEFEVSSVKDVLELLLQGAANRKMAATHMNLESSRSHSVLTCVIESRWEKDSMTHLRFGRLNLVDLAGSERQKSSGAEGERLKEAANINRSLSTLGLVIMTLVDIANGKSRHVPYRDSRLTFLLQDSLGGNSKTTIIANVSPSICSASETLSTLKFAQRAKLIQNNAKVNEDASGDVLALQRQIQTLKDQLNFLVKHQSVPRSLYYPSPGLEVGNSSNLFDYFDSLGGGNPNAFSDLGHLNQKVKHLETALTGALRREKMVEAEVRRLEAEIKHMNRLVHQREDDAQRTKVMLRLQEEKLRRLELLADDLVTSDGYLMGENAALSKEIQLLQERMESNPDLTQFALENMRLVEQLRMFQNFYHQGERELLLAEVSHLRNQLLKVLEGKFTPITRGATQGDDNLKESDSCKRQLDASLEDNARLTREIYNLRFQLKQYLELEQTAIVTVGDASTVNDRNKELDKQTPTLAKGESVGWIASCNHADKFPDTSPAQGMRDVPSQFGDVEKELKDARVLIKVMESQQVQLIAQLDKLKQENDRFLELLESQVHDETHLKKHHDYGIQLSEKLGIVSKASHANEIQIPECVDTQKLALDATLENAVKDVEEAKIMNKQPKDEHVSTWRQEMEQVQEQVEAETAKTILYLQEEIAALQQEVLSRNRDDLSSAANYELLRTRNEELNNRVHILMQENVKLSNLVTARDAETSVLSDEWEKAIIDLTQFLLDGCKSLEDASQYIESIVNSFPQGNAWINEHVERAIKVFVEKEKLIADLQKRVNDAQQIELEMKSKLDSLRGATLAITEVQQTENDENAKELFHLRKLLDEQVLKIEELENAVKCKENHIVDARKSADAAFLVIEKLFDMNASESLDVQITKSAINILLDEISQVESINQAEGSDPAKSEIHKFSMDARRDNIKNKILNEKSPVSVEDPSLKAQEANAEENSYALEELRVQVEMAIQRIVDTNKVLHTSYADAEKHIAAVISDINSTYSAMKMLFHDSINDVHGITDRIRELKVQRMTLPSIIVEDPKFGAHADIKSTAMQIIVDGLAKINESLSGIKSGFHSLFDASRTSSIHMHEDKLIPNNLLVQSLMEDVDFAMNAIVEIHFQLGMLFHDKDVANCFAQEIRSNQPSHSGADNMVLDVIPKYPSDQIAISELSHMLRTLEERIDEVDVDHCRTKEKLRLKMNHAWRDAEEKTKQATGFLLKFEKAQETMEEAELMLQALLKANEDAKCERDQWKQASQELLAERTTLVEELHQLEALNFSVDNQNRNLEKQIHSSIAEILGIAISLSESFVEMRRFTLEEVNVIWSDMFSFGHELLRWIGTSRSCLEETISEVMEKGFASLVLYQCQIGAFSEQNKHLIVDSSLQYRQLGSYSVLGNVENNHMDVPIDNSVTKGLAGMVVQDCKLNFFSLRNTEGVQNEFQTVEDLVVGPIGSTDTVENETTKLSSDQKCTKGRVAKFQKNYSDLTHDTELVKEMIAKMATYLDNVVHELTLGEEASICANFPVREGKTELVTVVGETVQTDMVSSGASYSDICKNFELQPNIFQDDEVGILKSKSNIHDERIGGAQTDTEVLLVDIGHLKHQCARLIFSHSDLEDDGELSLCEYNIVQESSVNKHNVKPMYWEKEETGRFHYLHAKTELGNKLIQTLNELRNNLCYIVGLVHPGLQFHALNKLTDSSLGKMFQNICSIEEKMYMLLRRGSNEVKEADIVTDAWSLKRESARKDNIIRGLLFDLRLLQESASNVKDMKDESREMVTTLGNVQHELAIKTAQINNILSRQRKLEAQLAESEAALSSSKSELEQAQKLCVMLTNENTELRLQLEDEHIRNTQTEELLEEKRKVIDGLEREILSNNSSVEGILDDLRRVSNDRNHLQAEIVYLNDKLDMAMTLVDEKEAIAVEACQVAESSKIYAEEKEEEVKILEHCIQELEGTINVMERKVDDMKEEVENHQLIRKRLEQEIHVLTDRMHMVENAAECLIAEGSSLGEESSEIPRRLDDRIIELCEARKHIEDLEVEIFYKEKEIKQYREHIAELVLHSEAQSSLYQEKFKALEGVFSDVKADASTSNPSESHAANKMEKNSARTRGSGSPFRCISSLIQQMNLEKDQELSVARHQIEELEALAANRQKEVCMLTARLAAVDSMTHDVIRDLLGVKLDLTNYADLIDQEELQKLLMTAQQQIEETKAKDMEILNLKKQINYLLEETDSLAEEVNQRKSDILASQVLMEQLQQRDQLLTAQNEMLKMDKANLHQKIAKMDETVKSLVGSPSIQDHLRHPEKTKESSQNVGTEELGNRLAESDKLLSHARNELARYHKSNSRMLFDQSEEKRLIGH